METRLAKAYDVCRRLQERHGKSYFFATNFFSEDVRLATHALYAFFRIPDEVVDNPATLGVADARAALEMWKTRWQEAYENNKSEDAVLFAAADTFHRFNIPYEYSRTFLDAMIQDTWKDRYATYADLQAYMYGSAAVVGLMMCHVIRFEHEALAYAEKLGYAMQLTNFLRDIREDWERRGRVYLPQDELARFSVSEAQLASGQVAPAFIDFMKFQIARADRLYEEANCGIHLLHPRGRFAVRAASDLYREILRKIERQRYNVFVKRAGTSTWEKAAISFRSRLRL
jgi:phytoene synthase